MEPIVDGLEREFAEALTVRRLDADLEENARLQQTYGLRGHPTFAVLDVDAHVVQSFTGPQTEEALYEAVTAVILSLD